MSTPAQNFDHLLDAVSGLVPMHDLQKGAPCSESNGIIYRGSLCSIHPADGKIRAGLYNDHSMALWAINSSRDLDVAGDDGNVATVGGELGTWPATGGLELKTTEFDIADLAGLTPNALLAAHLSHPGWVQLAAANYSNKAVVGVVSGAVATEIYAQKVLTFWPVFCPAVVTAGGASSN